MDNLKEVVGIATFSDRTLFSFNVITETGSMENLVSAMFNNGNGIEFKDFQELYEFLLNLLRCENKYVKPVFKTRNSITYNIVFIDKYSPQFHSRKYYEIDK